MKAIYFFAGGGGGTQGGISAGLQTVGATDIDKNSCSIHRRLLGRDRVLEADIRSLSVDELKERNWHRAQVAIAGSPCVDFSATGKREGITGHHGSLTLELVRILEGLETPFLIYENVPGFLTIRNGQDFLQFVAALDRAGYSGISTVVRGTHWVPQERTRIYLIAIHRRWINLGTRVPHFLGDGDEPNAIAALLGNLPLSALDPKSVVRAPLADLASKSLNFVTWHEGVATAANAEFENFPFCPYRLTDCLENGVALQVGGIGGKRLYSDVAPTLRGMNRATGATYRQPGTGNFKVVKPDFTLRPPLPEEFERLMGWEVGSTELNEAGKKICATERIRLLVNGMIPGAIAHQVQLAQKAWQTQNVSPLPGWVGNKRWLIPAMKHLYRFSRFVDPFCGSCAVPYGIGVEDALLADANPWLINFFKRVQKGLKVAPEFYRNEKEYFYAIREQCRGIALPDGDRDAAAFYYLVRTSVNQICRTNRQGQYNTPYGGIARKNIAYISDFSPFGATALTWEFRCQGFEEILQEVRKNDFLFLDPPYYSEKGGFVGYSDRPFGWNEQVKLVESAVNLACPIVACNAFHPKILALYTDAGFQVFNVLVHRKVSVNGDRTPAMEMLAFKNIDSDAIAQTLSKLPTSGD